MKLEAVHFSDVASCVPYYKELQLGEIIAAVGNVRISPLTSPVLLFYFILFYFFIFIL